MKLFECQSCGLPLHFENDRCGCCGHALDKLRFVHDLIRAKRVP